MTLPQTIAGISVTILWTARFVMNKEARLHGCTPTEITFSNAVWMMLGTLGVVFFFWQSDFLPFFAQGTEAIFPLTISATKGLSWYLLALAMAQISRQSVSSAAFAMSSGLPVASLTVMLLLGETLSRWDITAVLLIGALSFLFFLKGHAATLTAADKRAYLTIIACVTYNMVADKISAIDQSWAVHLAVSTLAWILIPLGLALWKNEKRNNHPASLFKVLPVRPAMLLGLSVLGGVALLMYSMQHIFGVVVLPVIFIRVATPLTMLIGARFYREGRWQDQILFGCCVVVPAIMAILF